MLFFKKTSQASIIILLLAAFNILGVLMYFNYSAKNKQENFKINYKEKDKTIRLTLNNQEKIILEIDLDDDRLNLNINNMLKNLNDSTKPEPTNEAKKNITTEITKPISIDLCPLIPANLSGRITVNTETNNTDLAKIEKELESLKLKQGGEWSPSSCIARFKVAIIVPYRNRETNLKIFLRHMHQFLTKQQIEYGIYLIEPIQNVTFNRGLLMNVGFLESLKMTSDKWDCFMFHDVDLIPEDDRNIYSCPETPRHMSSAVSTFNYRLPYDSIFGGVSSLTKEQMKKINGYSNLYFGWGGEDDDFRARIVNNKFTISRYPLEIGRYLMANHDRDQKANPERHNLLKSAVDRMPKEGLTSIEYKITEIEKTFLYTKILVNYDEKYLLEKKL